MSNKTSPFMINVPIIKETQLHLQERRHVKEQGSCHVIYVWDGCVMLCSYRRQQLCEVVRREEGSQTTANEKRDLLSFRTHSVPHIKLGQG